MEIVFYAVIFIIVVSVCASLVQSIFFPPVEIDSSELPDVIHHELNSHFPSFHANKITWYSPRQRYLIRGSVDDRRCKIEFDLTPDNEIHEIEYADLSGSTRFVNKTAMQVTALPSKIGEVMNPFLVEAALPDSCQVFSGMFGSENGFQIKIRTENYEYEFEITESGRLVEYEREQIGI